MRRRRWAPWLGAALAVAVVVATVGPTRRTDADVEAGDGGEAGAITVAGSMVGDDWSLPAGTQVAANSGFFSERASPARHIDTRSVDVTWRMIEPADGQFRDDLTGGAEGDPFDSLADQLAAPGRFWLRVWISNVDWAPQWVVDDCDLEPAGQSAGDHLPIWNDCFWGHAVDLYRHLFIDLGLRDDPRLALAYVPGAFEWAEFDLDVPDQAVAAGDLTVPEFTAWFHDMVDDLTGLMGDQVHKLVFTGEDHPFADFGEADDLLARDAVAAGMGVRTGISELSNFHLNEVPAYGTAIGADGHLVTDEGWVLRDPERISAAEHECFNDCGFQAEHLGYAIRQANLHALAALRTNWLYVVPHDSYLDRFAAHWNWVRHSLGQRADTSADAWVALRRATDEFWADDDQAADAGIDWVRRPQVRNLERWLAQTDAVDGCRSRLGRERHEGELGSENGTAVEGRRTNTAHGQDHLCFRVDDAFLDPEADADVDVLVTYLDRGRGGFRITVPGQNGRLQSPEVTQRDTGKRRTVRFQVTDGRFDGSLPGAIDLRVSRVRGADVDVQFVRVVER